MIYDLLSLGSIAVLFFVALWCIFSSRYDDGLIGKLIFIMLALSCYAVLSEYPQRPADITRATLMVSLASAAVRHVFLFQIMCKFPFKRIRGFFND